MLPFLAKAMIPIGVVFITAFGAIKGLGYIKDRSPKKNETLEQEDEFV